jgi:SecD/SecF fusion protein
MQSKGAIRFFAIMLAIVCVYQLSFTLVTRNAENKAREYAKGDEGKERSYLDSISTIDIFNLGVKNYTYQECKEREINLGLDLKGGMNVTLEVSVVDVIKSMSNYSTDPAFNKSLEDAIAAEKNSQKDYVTLFAEAYAKNAPNAKLAAIFSTIELKDKVSFNSTNDDVIKVIRTESNGAIDRSFNILRTRIDKFGVTQPNIQKLGSGRILIELPGVNDPERVRKLLQGTAKLEFWETYDNKDVFESLIAVNKMLKVAETLNADSAKTAKVDTAKTKGKDVAVITAKKDTSAKKSSLLQKLENKSKTDTGKTASADTSKSLAKDAKDNPLFVLLHPAIVQNEKGQQEYRKGPVVGYTAIKDTGRLNKILAMNKVKALLPKDLRLLWSVKPMSKTANALELIAIKVSSRDGRAPLEGDAIADARQDFGQINHSPEIAMSMTAEGAQKWKVLTGKNIEHSIAIVLDNYVYSYPNVQGEIAGGRSSITGSFEINEAKDLANILKAGKLPAPAHIVEEAIVGPSLGKEAINAGFASFGIALVLVLLFMGFYYSTAGWVANVALFANVFFIIGVLSSLGAVLTLPGIAGMVLTIGLSVDANILIFERVREEMALGKGLRLAITDGFKHAMSSIIDSNVTTLLLGIILYVFGNGPIQGFATTLIIGICTSLFAAIFISRLIFEYLLDKNKVIKFSRPSTAHLFKNIHIDFVGKRKIYYLISSAIIICGVISFMTKGFNLGVDFKGGRTYVIQTKKDFSVTELRDALTKPFEVAPEVKTFGQNNRMKITTTYLINETGTDIDKKVEDKLEEGLITLQGEKAEIISSQKVGPTIADDITKSAIWAILFSCVLMFVYIFVRFKKWQFGLGAVAALFHDVLVVLSFYTILNGVVPFSLEIDQAFIAAILTVMGYSMTDTVVVFDRIREYLNHTGNKNLTKAEMTPVINDALNNTLSRTINTSLTIFFVLLAIFIFGGDVIRGFSFALLIGIVIGTYSSICVATPIVVDLDRRKNDDK